MKLVAYILVAVAIAAAGIGGLEIRDGYKTIKLDPPCAQPPKPGGITGTVSPGKYGLDSIEACRRDTGKKYKPVSFDKSSGKFEFRNLPGGAKYDLRITTTDGSIFEGADMSLPDSYLAELAEMRKKIMGVPQPPQRPFTKTDADEINALITGTKGFANITRVMIIKGHGRHATALVELIRTGKVAEIRTPGTIIWRVDLWYFERTGDAWRKMDNQERTLERIVTSQEKLAAITIAFDPMMSVKIQSDGKSSPVEIKLPDSPPSSASRPAGAELKMNTNPLILE